MTDIPRTVMDMKLCAKAPDEYWDHNWMRSSEQHTTTTGCDLVNSTQLEQAKEAKLSIRLLVSQAYTT